MDDHLGRPYEPVITSEKFDCSKFVEWAWRQLRRGTAR